MVLGLECTGLSMTEVCSVPSVYQTLPGAGLALGVIGFQKQALIVTDSGRGDLPNVRGLG